MKRDTRITIEVGVIVAIAMTVGVAFVLSLDFLARSLLP